MEISIDRDSSEPLHRQISERLREMILDGRLPDGFRLPSERALSRSLRVNRGTVFNAYARLKEEGLAGAHVGRGTVVLPRRPMRQAAASYPFPWQQLLKSPARYGDESVVRELQRLAADPQTIDFAVGGPSPDLEPVDHLQRMCAALQREAGAALLQHSPTEGLPRLRESVVEHMTSRGVPCSPGEILVTSGAQQGFDLALRVLLEPGDAVVVEEPTYPHALHALRYAGARVLSVPSDEEGVRTDALESLLQRYRPRLIYTMPTFQNPSAVTMSLERRLTLLELARRFQVPVLEDDHYSVLRYEGKPLPALRALDEHGVVVHLASLSRICYPGLRIGWVVAPRPAIRALAAAKRCADLHSSTPAQWLMDWLLRDAHLGRYLETARAEYSARRDEMHEALLDKAPKGLEWSKPEGGMYLWCRLPEWIDQRQLMAESARRHVSFLPGSICYAGEPAQNAIRLSFTTLPRELIREGVGRLMGALRACQPASRSDGAALEALDTAALL